MTFKQALDEAGIEFEGSLTLNDEVFESRDHTKAQQQANGRDEALKSEQK